MRNKKILYTVLKCGLSTGALWLVFYTIPFFDLWRLMKGAHPLWIVAASVLFAMSKLSSAIRLCLFLTEGDIYMDRSVHVKLYWLGMFYNQFLPSGIGGDAYKTFWISKRTDTSKVIVAKLIFGDRLSGLMALCLLLSCLLGSVFPLLWPIVGFCASLVLYLVYFYAMIKWKVTKRIHFTRELYSILVQLFQLGSAFCLLKSLDVGDHLVSYLVLFLVSSLAAVLPITLGGIGVRELVFMTGSEHLGLAVETGTAIGLLFYILSMIVSLGGIFYVFSPITFAQSESLPTII